MSTDRPGVLVVGEALVDVVTPAASPTTEHVGGSPANVALGLARLGHPTGLVACLGNDARGAAVREHLARGGVELDARPIATTGTASARLDVHGAAEYAFDLAWAPGPIALPPGTGHVHTGSLAAALDPGAADVLRLLDEVRATGTVSFDPNVRPSITPDRTVVAERVAEVARRADVVKASAEDLAWLHPDRPEDAVVAELLDTGPWLVVVTDAGAGVRWWTAAAPDSPGTRAARDVDVLDTVGAGDSFMAGLVSGLLDAGLLGAPRGSAHRGIGADDTRIVTAIERGLATSAVTVSRAGAYAPVRTELS